VILGISLIVIGGVVMLATVAPGCHSDDSLATSVVSGKNTLFYSRSLRPFCSVSSSPFVMYLVGRFRNRPLSGKSKLEPH